MEKSEERKAISVQRLKQPIPSRADGALIGDEEQNEKQKRIKRKKQGEGSQPRYPGPFSHLLQHAEIIRRVYSFYSPGSLAWGDL